MLLPGTPADTYLLASSLRSWVLTMSFVILLVVTVVCSWLIYRTIDNYGKHRR
jgi:hypothetical protein